MCIVVMKTNWFHPREGVVSLQNGGNWSEPPLRFTESRRAMEDLDPRAYTGRFFCPETTKTSEQSKIYMLYTFKGNIM